VSGVCAPSARRPCAGKQTRGWRLVSITWKWQETASTIVNADDLAIAVLQLGATPSGARRRYMALAA
jgi:hypothetical protein